MSPILIETTQSSSSSHYWNLINGCWVRETSVLGSPMRKKRA